MGKVPLEVPLIGRIEFVTRFSSEYVLEGCIVLLIFRDSNRKKTDETILEKKKNESNIV